MIKNYHSNSCSLFKKATKQNPNSSIGIFNLTFTVQHTLYNKVDILFKTNSERLLN